MTCSLSVLACDRLDKVGDRGKFPDAPARYVPDAPALYVPDAPPPHDAQWRRR